MAHPAIGDVVHAWPHPGQIVRSHDPAILVRTFLPEGADLPWSAWLEEMHGQGHVHLTDPAPTGAHGAYSTHPGEPIAYGRSREAK